VMKSFLMTMCFAALAVSAALGQQKKTLPPLPKPDQGPSLEITMKFIQDKLNGIGPLNYLANGHNNVEGMDWTNQYKVEATSATAEPSACRINYYWKEERDGVATFDAGLSINLREVEDMAVMTMEQNLKTEDAVDGLDRSYKVDPSVFVLKVRRTDKGFYILEFFDEQMANRMAKALVHAVELCGGGSTTEPF